jgi:dTDP-4-amino-4,6-dideoxygalactose transaminase
MGTIGCLSFYPTKNLGACGDAGMALTDDPDHAARMKCLRIHGMEPKYYHQHLGWNARLDALQAALLRVKLPHLESWLRARQAVARRYEALIEEYKLEGLLEPPVPQPQRRHTFNYYVVRVADGQRDALAQHLKAEQIGCEIYYPMALHQQECLRYLGSQEGDFPISEAACRSVLALPIYPELTLDQQRRVIQTCAAHLRKPMRCAA